MVATLAAALLLYGALGHGLPQSMDGEHDGMGQGTVGLCLLLFTVLAVLRTPRPPSRTRGAPMCLASASIVRIPAERPSDARERASPARLQRFLN